MEIPKPSDADKDFFRSVLPGDPEIEIKPMFGNLGAFVHGNMFAGLFGPDVGVRLDEARREELACGRVGSGLFRPRPEAAHGRLPEPAPGLARHPGRRRGCVEQAHGYVATLPPKQKKPRPGKSGLAKP